MSSVRDRVLNSSLDDLVASAERGEIDPDELWQEVLDSLERSVDLLRQANDGAPPSGAHADWLMQIEQRQDRVDAMIAEWRSEIEQADLDLPGPSEESSRAAQSA